MEGLAALLLCASLRGDVPGPVPHEVRLAGGESRRHPVPAVVVGLVRGFMHAGVPRVVASSWSVPDAATAELMRRFYEGLLVRGRPPAAALREAQLGLRSTVRWRDPYHWAGFTLYGDWRS